MAKVSGSPLTSSNALVPTSPNSSDSTSSRLPAVAMASLTVPAPTPPAPLPRSRTFSIDTDAVPPPAVQKSPEEERKAADENRAATEAEGCPTSSDEEQAIPEASVHDPHRFTTPPLTLLEPLNPNALLTSQRRSSICNLAVFVATITVGLFAAVLMHHYNGSLANRVTSD